MVIYLLSLSMIFKSFKLIFRSVLIAYERFKIEAVVTGIERLILLIFCMVTLMLGYGLTHFAAAFTAAGLINLGVVIIFVKKKSIDPLSISIHPLHCN